MITTGSGGSVLGGQANAGYGGDATLVVMIASLVDVGGACRSPLRCCARMITALTLRAMLAPRVPPGTGSITMMLGDGGNVVNGTGSAGNAGAAAVVAMIVSRLVVGQSSAGSLYNNGNVTVIGGRGGNVDARTDPTPCARARTRFDC
jgi:hypothetical protein